MTTQSLSLRALWRELEAASDGPGPTKHQLREWASLVEALQSQSEQSQQSDRQKTVEGARACFSLLVERAKRSDIPIAQLEELEGLAGAILEAFPELVDREAQSYKTFQKPSG